jgi:flagellin-like protein
MPGDNEMNETNSVHGDTRAVSPVIGVILMVAITVILAAVIGTFVLNLGGSVQENVQAGVSIEHDGGNNEIKITWTTNQNADSIDVQVDDGGSVSTASLTNVGDSKTFSCTDGNQVDVTATGINGDSSTVLTTDTIDDC